MFDLGFLIWGIIGVVIIVICIIVIIVSVVIDGELETKLIAGVIALVAFGLYNLTYFPVFNLTYHVYEPVSGTVSEVSNRIVSDGSSINQKFVVVFEGEPQEYGCLDTRCALVETGDFLSLSCIGVFNYAGTDAFDCQFVSREKGE